MAVIVEVKVTPRASTTEVVGWEGDRLRVRVAAPPEKGKANQELIRFLRKRLKRRVELISGETSRIKRVEIEGIELAELRGRL